jgi:hypothetical protein
MKDDYDFTSALVYTVQERNHVLGLVNFRNPGGDKHPSLDPVRDGRFRASRLSLRFDVVGVRPDAAHLAGNDSIALDAGLVKIWVRFPHSALGSRQGAAAVEKSAQGLLLSLDLVRETEPATIQWADARQAFAVFQFVMEDTAEPLARFAERLAATPFRARTAAEWEWSSPAGVLSIAGGTAPASAAEQDRAFRDAIGGQPVPRVRLSDIRLV